MNNYAKTEIPATYAQALDMLCQGDGWTDPEGGEFTRVDAEFNARERDLVRASIPVTVRPA